MSQALSKGIKNNNFYRFLQENNRLMEYFRVKGSLYLKYFHYGWPLLLF